MGCKYMQAYNSLTVTPEVNGEGVLVGGQCQDIHTDNQSAPQRDRGVEDAQVITVEIAKCYNSAIAVVEAQRACGNEGVTREAFWRKWPECGCWRGKEGGADEEEEKRKSSWRSKSSVEEYSHRCERMYRVRCARLFPATTCHASR